MVVPKYIIICQKDLGACERWRWHNEILPDYKEIEPPPRDFMLTILTTYNSDAMAQLVVQARNKRAIILDADNDNIIEIDPSVKESIRNSNIMKSYP